MKTSGILTLGGAVIAVLALLFGSVMLKAFLFERGQGFAYFAGLAVAGALLAAGVALIATGRRRARYEAERDDHNFSELALGLARKQGGELRMDEVCKASGLPREEAVARMRALTGRGVFDLDFDPAGQMIWKLSGDAGRAQLAELAGRS